MYCLVRNKQVVRYFWRLAHRETLENGKWPDVTYEVPLNPGRTQTKLVTSDVCLSNTKTIITIGYNVSIDQKVLHVMTGFAQWL